MTKKISLIALIILLVLLLVTLITLIVANHNGKNAPTPTATESNNNQTAETLPSADTGFIDSLAGEKTLNLNEIAAKLDALDALSANGQATNEPDLNDADIDEF